MATLAQLTANRANAQHSTGPRSAEGKSVSRLNALQHGVDAHLPIIPGEDPAAYQTLAAEYQGRFQPQTPDEHYHVETMIDSDWQKRRLSRLETDLYNILDLENPGMSLAAALLTASPAAKLLARTQRQLTTHQRAWYRAFTELRRQREREQTFDEQPYEPFVSEFDDSPDLLPADRKTPVHEIAGTNPIPPAKAPQTASQWPGADPVTGRPSYFIG